MYRRFYCLSRKIFKTTYLQNGSVELMILSRIKIDRDKVEEITQQLRKVYPMVFDVIEEFEGFQFKSRKELFYFIIDEIWLLEKRIFTNLRTALFDVLVRMRYVEVIWEEIKNEKYIIPNEDIIWEIFCLRTIQTYKT